MKPSIIENGPNLLAVIGEQDVHPFLKEGMSVLSVPVEETEWNDLLSPWPAEPVFRKSGGFGGKADAFIREIEADLNQACASHPGRKYIIGYSLAGLFSLYLCTKRTLFDGCASVSGSLWFPGWTEYLKANPVHCSVVYLSLGDREKDTKNAVMATVEDGTRATETILSGYTSAVFEKNPGGHFDDPQGRLEKALEILWAMDQIH